MKCINIKFSMNVLTDLSEQNMCMMAFEMFKDFGYENVVNVDCICVKEDD